MTLIQKDIALMKRDFIAMSHGIHQKVINNKKRSDLVKVVITEFYRHRHSCLHVFTKLSVMFFVIL